MSDGRIMDYFDSILYSNRFLPQEPGEVRHPVTPQDGHGATVSGGGAVAPLEIRLSLTEVLLLIIIVILLVKD